MANESVNAATNAVEEAKQTKVELTAKVVRVQIYNENVVLELDKEFESIKNTGEVIQTNKLNFNRFSLIPDLAKVSKEFKMIEVLRGGRDVKDECFTVLLTDADIKVTREFKTAGEARRHQSNGDEVYTFDCWVNTINVVNLNVIDEFKQLKQMLLMSPTKPKQELNVNFFNS